MLPHPPLRTPINPPLSAANPNPNPGPPRAQFSTHCHPSTTQNAIPSPSQKYPLPTVLPTRRLRQLPPTQNHLVPSLLPPSLRHLVQLSIPGPKFHQCRVQTPPLLPSRASAPPKRRSMTQRRRKLAGRPQHPLLPHLLLSSPLPLQHPTQHHKCATSPRCHLPWLACTTRWFRECILCMRVWLVRCPRWLVRCPRCMRILRIRMELPELRQWATRQKVM